MPRLRVSSFSLSLDGYGAGPNQSHDNPIGIGGADLHDWMVATRSFRKTHGLEGGEQGIDDEYVSRAGAGIWATIMGRNMFGPVRGPWGGEDWAGWWGDEPPFHNPVFVLTHHPREPITMQGGTTFHFVTGGVEAALERAFEAANGDDVQIGGGVATIQQYLRAGLIDEIHLAIVPTLLGGGERLFDNLESVEPSDRCVELVASPSVVHARLIPSTASRGDERPDVGRLWMRGVDLGAGPMRFRPGQGLYPRTTREEETRYV